ncbi:MAG: choice-of-anchor I family protein [Candidatus Kapaibacterium sp.]
MRELVRNVKTAARRVVVAGGILATGAFFSQTALGQSQPWTVELSHLGTYESGLFDEGGAEIGAYDARSERIFVTNAGDNSMDVLDASDPENLTLDLTVDLSSYGGGPNSVAVYRGIVAVAVQADEKTDNGSVVFFNTDGDFLNSVEVGALPDMVTFTHNGQYLLVANEGEPNDDYDVDPEGSVSIIDMKGRISQLSSSDVSTVSFTSLNSATLDGSIRIFGPDATVAQDLEPEYIAVSHDSKYAYVTLQENNAIAVIDIKRASLLSIFGLGFKDHSATGNGIDASDRDDEINIANWPVYGMYMPDALAAYHYRGDDYLVTANEGDARDYDGFAEEERVKDLTLDPTAFPDADDLQENEEIGRLTVTTVNGDTDGDGDYDELYAFGARSFSIFATDGTLVYDSQDDFEQITALLYPDDFNSTNDENGSFDNRSDNKGPEPEGLTLGTIKGRTYAFIGLERMGGVMVYDITDPSAPSFVEYVNNRDFSGDAEDGTAGDLGPEGILFVDKSSSPTNSPLLIVTNEVSGTTTVYEINSVQSGSSKSVSEDLTVAGELEAISPNPATTDATISFEMKREGRVSIEIVTARGEKVATLLDEERGAGENSATLNFSELPQGAYFSRLTIDGHITSVRPIQIVR